MAVLDSPGRPAGRGPRSLTATAIALAALGVVALALLAALSAQAAIVALVVLTVAVVLSYVPKTATAYLLGFILLLFVIPSTLTVSGPLNGIGQPSTILGWGAGVLWIAHRLAIDSGLNRQRNPARWVVLFFAVVIILAFGTAYTRPLTHLEIQGTYRSIAKLAAYVGVGLLTMDGLRDRADINKLLKGLVLGATFSAVIGLIQFRTGFNYIEKVHFPGLVVSNGLNAGAASTRQGLHRVIGTAHHPIEYAAVLCAILPLALHYSIHLPASRFRNLMRASAVLIAVAIPTSISRTGAVGIVIAVVVVAADWSWRRRANLAGIAIVAAAAVSIAIPRLLGTVKGLFGNLGSKSSISHRTNAYDNLAPYLHGHLLFGRGQGTFQVGQYFTLDDQYLNTLLAAGIVGVVAVALVYLSIIFLGRGARRRAIAQVDRSLGQALAAGGLVLAFSAATFDLFGFTQAVGLTFLLLGVSGAFWRVIWVEQQERRALAAPSAPAPDSELVAVG